MKLELKIEDLRVDTFETTRRLDQERGTVRANEGSQPANCFSDRWTCFLDASCGETCDMSCDQTCFNTDVCCI